MTCSVSLSLCLFGRERESAVLFFNARRREGEVEGERERMYYVLIVFFNEVGEGERASSSSSLLY